MPGEGLKPVIWVGSSRKDLRTMPEDVRLDMGFAIDLAQRGDMHADAKPLRGFGGAGVVEILSDHRGDTYRGVYTVRFPEAVYVLHVFQKKSKQGIATPKTELDLIRQRLRQVELRRGGREP